MNGDCIFKTCTESSVRRSFHDSIHLVTRSHWDEVIANGTMYLSYDHLKCLEDAMADRIDFQYVVFHCEQFKPIGVAYYQSVDFLDNGSDLAEQAGELAQGIGSRLMKDRKVRCLVNGNVYHTGVLGYHFKADISPKDQLELVAGTTRALLEGKYFNPKPSVSIFKEFKPDQWQLADQALNKYHRLHLDVNMVLDLDPSWKTIDDYKACLHAKARNRFGNILKRSESLEIKGLSAVQIANLNTETTALFRQVISANPYGFELFETGIYAQWKELHGDALIFLGYFLNGQLLGFNVAFKHGDLLDAHYVGFDHKYVKDYLIYQRMLADLVEIGIRDGMSKVYFGRTAEVAKSGFGARPEDLMLYLRYRSSLGNHLIKRFITSISPSEFELRNPFKKVTS